MLLGVACLSATNCQAVGDDSVDTYPGRALLLDVTPSTQGFSPERVSSALDAAVSASCASTAVCAVAAVDPYGNPMLVRTIDGGTAWSNLALPPQFAQVDQVLCWSATSCLVSGSDADGQGSVWRTTDAGVAWVRRQGLGERGRGGSAAVPDGDEVRGDGVPRQQLDGRAHELERRALVVHHADGSGARN